MVPLWSCTAARVTLASPTSTGWCARARCTIRTWRHWRSSRRAARSWPQRSRPDCRGA